MEGYNLQLFKDSFATIQRLLMAEFSSSKNGEAKNETLQRIMSELTEKEKDALNIIGAK